MRILISLLPHNLLNKFEKNPPAAIMDPGIQQLWVNVIWFVLEQTQPLEYVRNPGNASNDKNEHKMASAIRTWQTQL